MLKSLKTSLLLASFVLLLPFFVSAQAGWVINSFDSEINILEDGAVEITETIAVDFDQLAKHGIYRDLPQVYRADGGAKEYSQINNIEVKQDGEPAIVKLNDNKANLRIRVGDADKTISGEHVYEISYNVLGVLRGYDGFDELFWNVTGNDWEANIASATATVTVPAKILQAACYQGVVGSDDSCVSSSFAEARARFESSSILPGDDFSVAVGFEQGVIPIVEVKAPPSFLEVALSLKTLGIVFVTAVLGFYIALRHWVRYGRDRYWQRFHLPGERSDRDGLEIKERILPLFSPKNAPVEYDSPDGLKPAEVGVLLDERADTVDVSATIVDLATHGFLTITEVEKKWIFGSTDYQLKRLADSGTGLAKYEEELLKKIFEDGSEVKLSELKNKFYKDLKEVKDLLYQEVVDKKLFAARPDKVRLKYFGVSLLVDVVGIGLIVLAVMLIEGASTLAWHHYLLAGIGIGIALLAVPMFIISYSMPRKTGYGRELYRRSQGYELFVSGTEKYRAKFLEDKGLFEKALPYAIMFGVTDKLAKAFAEAGIEPQQPSWYYGAHAFNVSQFSTSINSFSKSLSTAMASSPSSSGSGGGGFSGGGFGGGGGGSW